MTAENSRDQVQVYTDGGCDPNPGPGGWGVVLVHGVRTKEISGADAATTNNRMEITAAAAALRVLKRSCDVTLYTDSEYLRKGITEWIAGWQARGWRKADGKPVENQDLWQELLREAQRHQVKWRWVKGHRGNLLNERADRLATAARRRLLGDPVDDVDDATSDAPSSKPASALPEVDVYTHGCSLGNPGPGGYAAVLVPAPASGQPPPAPRVVSGAWPLTTNNVMDLWAVVAALQSLRRRSHVTLHVANKYVLDGATRWLALWERRGWQTQDGQPVKNQELWQELTRAMGDHDIAWKAPSGGKRDAHGQQAADEARRAAENLKAKQAHG